MYITNNYLYAFYILYTHVSYSKYDMMTLYYTCFSHHVFVFLLIYIVEGYRPHYWQIIHKTLTMKVIFVGIIKLKGCCLNCLHLNYRTRLFSCHPLIYHAGYRMIMIIKIITQPPRQTFIFKFLFKKESIQKKYN